MNIISLVILSSSLWVSVIIIALFFAEMIQDQLIFSIFVLLIQFMILELYRVRTNAITNSRLWEKRM